MPSTLISNIKFLAGIHSGALPLRGEELADLQVIQDAFLLIEGRHIASFGRMDELVNKAIPSTIVDARGGALLPAWCDSHTHLVFAGSRENEFVDKIRGMTYAQIAARGGGILQSAKLLQETSEDQLFREAAKRLQHASALGTASIEIKSGYGLTVESELKMLRVIKRLKQQSRLNIKATFLGAHAYPSEFASNHAGYLRMVIDEMLPAIAAENLADYVDVFCEKGFFSNAETSQICEAAKRFGLKPKVHANQLSTSGAVETAVRSGAVSVDHLEVMDESAIAALQHSATIGTLLPSAAFFLRMPYPPARQMIDSNCALALASDGNPGSSPSFNMNFVLSLACIGLKMLPEEAILAATFNGACAMELQRITGSIGVGKDADLLLTTPVPSLAYLPYAFGDSLIDRVFIKGECIH